MTFQVLLALLYLDFGTATNLDIAIKRVFSQVAVHVSLDGPASNVLLLKDEQTTQV